MNRSLASVFVLLTLALGGCQGESAPTSWGGTEDEVVLTFDAAWNESQSGALYAGRPVRLAYDASRLPCRGTRYGRPAYSILAHWRVGGGDFQTVQVDGLASDPRGFEPVFVPERTGTLELYFSNSSAWGCQAFDSDFGANYRFQVQEHPGAPGWMGNEAVVIGRATCDGGPCAADRRPLADGFRYDTWARQRAAIRGLYFDVWKAGVTDFDNPDLWRQLDARVYYRFAGESDWRWAYVPSIGRVGNDARYQVSLRELDPFGLYEGCPDAPFTIVESSGGPAQAEASVELYFMVNGVALRGPEGGPFRGTFVDDATRWAGCR